MKKLLQSIIILLIISVTSPNSFGNSNEDICVNADVVEINPTQIEKNEEFVIGINIENCGQKNPNHISFEITQLPKNIIVVENLKTEISKFSYSNSQRFITYHMRATNKAKPGTHTIKMKLNFEKDGIKQSKEYEISINIKGNEADLQIQSLKTKPNQIYLGEVVELNLELKNYGKGIANNINLKLDYNLIGIKELSLGSLEKGETNTALFKFKVNKLGLLEIPVIFSYEDDFGHKQTKSIIKLTGFKKKPTLNIASMKTTPMLPKIGDNIELVMRIENFGKKEINSIKVNVNHPFEGNKETFIGTLKAGEDGPSILSLIPKEAGEFEIPVEITYRDDFGEEKILETLKISVSEIEKNSNSLFITLFLIIIIIILIYYNLKTKNSKDKIIKQLMKGKNLKN